MRGNLANREPERLQKWQQQDLYQKIRDARQGRTRYVLHDGPPYANGDIHIGGAGSNILKQLLRPVRVDLFEREHNSTPSTKIGNAAFWTCELFFENARKP